MKGPRSLALLSCLAVAFAASAQDSNPELPTGATVSVRLKGGATIEAVHVQRTAGLVYMTLANGQILAYSVDDIVWMELSEPTKADREGRQQIVPEGGAQDALRQLARDRHLTDNSIELTGDPATATSPSPGMNTTKSKFEVERDLALEELRAAVREHADLASRTSANITKYLNVCSGSMVAQGSGTTTGFGQSAGTGVAAFAGAGNWGRFAGVTGFSWQGWSSWQEHHEWESRIPNDETPFCRALAGEIVGAVLALRPIVLPAITKARLSGVLQMEVDSALVSNGYGTSRFWLEE